ncbi:MAG: ATPase domain-containing protein [archaeon]|nr:ATPase domain-containing protein [archaeon]
MPFGIKFRKKSDANSKEEKKPVFKEEEILKELEGKQEADEETNQDEDEVLPSGLDKPNAPVSEAIEDEVIKRQLVEPRKQEFMPAYVSAFDELIDKHGLERGSTLLISGGCGTGKSTFCMQSIYNGLKHGEKAVYILFEESPEKLKRHMTANFGWELHKMEQGGKLAIIRLNPFRIARSVEASLLKQRKALLVKVEQLQLPFEPDRIVVDSLSALSVAFMGNTENYRYYIKHMFDSLDQYNSVNYVISETEQDPGIYSRTGIEEFLADGVVVLYNVKVGTTRKRGLEILKLRFSNHVKDLVPYQITKNGIEIYPPNPAASAKMNAIKKSKKGEEK